MKANTLQSESAAAADTATPVNVKLVYAFGPDGTEGSRDLKHILGGKGAGLAEMSLLGVPVPPGFTITTGACNHFHATGEHPQGLREQVLEHLARLEATLGQRFGDPEDPLLVSVRSGGPVSMPGMMDTVLNLGLSRRALGVAREPEAHRFLLDCYRRLLAMYGDVVLGAPEAEIDEIEGAVVAERGVASVDALDVAGLEQLNDRLEDLLGEHGGLPEEPLDQLWGAIDAVFRSWGNRRAVEYRRLHHLPEDMGTGVNVQAMVFGNRGPDCGTGVAFSRSPSDGAPQLYGEFLVNAQGEDIVAGTHTPMTIGVSQDGDGMRGAFPEAHAALEEVSAKLERHFRDMQDMEFTIQHGRLWMLQTRTGKRSGPAAVRIAADMVEEGILEPQEAIARVEPSHVIQMMAPEFDPEQLERAHRDGRLIARGLPAGPGAAAGKIALSAERAVELARSAPVLLVRDQTSPEDIAGLYAARGILTTRGGMTSHAAVVARGLGRPCVVGAGDIVVDEAAGAIQVGELRLREGEELAIDGTRGEVLVGAFETRPPEVVSLLLGERAAGDVQPTTKALIKVLGWADRARRLRVRANADTPEDAAAARAFGAEGIGLCRTEHMFFAEERIAWMRRTILAADAEQRREALEHLRPMQEADFVGIFRALQGLPVTIRLLDPPLHEFLPHEDSAIAQLAKRMGRDPAEVAAEVEALVEVNPMLGHRGCRLGVTTPEIYAMQAEAIARAACSARREGLKVLAEIMIPLAGTEREIAQLRGLITRQVEKVQQEEGLELDVLIGTMIEVPRAALVADRIAEAADFFSFGTNDLTQMTFGFSRDDAGTFLPQYIEDGILPEDPFASLDVEGVGQLVELAVQRGRAARPELKLGVCGEHGGDPKSIAFFERCGLDYVSCSPYRIPVARLAAARAALARED